MWDGSERRKYSKGVCSAHSGLEADIKNISSNMSELKTSVDNFHTLMRVEISEIKKAAQLAFQADSEIRSLGNRLDDNDKFTTRIDERGVTNRSWLYGITISTVALFVWILKKTI